MGEKERAEALLQAAGVVGVAVAESPETVTLPKSELEALRAAATPPAAGAPEIPAAPPAPVAGAQTPPAGKAPLRTQADVEALSESEFAARYGEVEAVLRGAR